MDISESYIEMLNRSFRPSMQEGCRPFPAACLEIKLLEDAQRKAQERELALFGQLCQIFDWQLSRRQRRHYLSCLREGLTLVLTDLPRTILWTSRSFLTLTGYTTAEVLSKPSGLFQLTEADDRIRRYVNDRLNRGKAAVVTLRNYRKNGEGYWCRVGIDPLRNSQGDLTHYLTVAREISQETTEPDKLA